MQVRIILENRDISPYVVEVCRNSFESFSPDQCFKTEKEAEKYIEKNFSNARFDGLKKRGTSEQTQLN